MDFIGKKSGGKLIYPPAVAEQKRRHWRSIPEGADVKSSLAVQRQARTNKQLGAIWGLMIAQAVTELDDRGYDTSFILNTPNPTGIAIDKNLLCDYFYNVCPIFDEDGKRITLSKMNIEQAMKFFGDVRNFLASQWSIVVPEPDVNWREKEK